MPGAPLGHEALGLAPADQTKAAGAKLKASFDHVKADAKKSMPAGAEDLAALLIDRVRHYERNCRCPNLVLASACRMLRTGIPDDRIR